MTDTKTILNKLLDIVVRYRKQIGETGVGNHIENEIKEYLASSPSGSEALPSSTPQSVEGQIQKQLAEKGNQLGSIVGTIPDLPMSDAFDSYKEKYGTDAAVGHAFKKGAEFGYSQLVGDKERIIQEYKKDLADQIESTRVVMVKNSQAQKEVEEWRTAFNAAHTEMADRGKEVEYWKALYEAANKVLSLVDFGLGVKDCSQTSEFGEAYGKWQALKQQPIK